MQTKFSNKDYKQEANDDIDLSTLVNLIQALFRKIANAISFVFALIGRNIRLLILFFILGALIGWGGYYITKPYYTSSMTLFLADIRNQFVENQLEKLSIMIREDNLEAVAANLDITTDDAKKIKDMRFYNLDQDKVSEDSILTGSPFRIELSLYDNSLFSSMEPALVNYLESNRFFSKQKLIKQKGVENMISKLKNDISSIDSIKANVISPQGPVNGFVYGEPIDPTNLYRESISMYQKQVKLEAELEQIDNIQVVNGFAPRLRPASLSLFHFILVFGFIVFLIGVLVAAFIETNKKKTPF